MMHDTTDQTSPGNDLRQRIFSAASLIKYGFSVLLFILYCVRFREFPAALLPLCEIALVFVFQELFVKRFPKAVWLISSFLLLLINAQLIVYFFGNSFISMVMITNLEFLQDLSGHMLSYGLAALLGVAVSFLPVRKLLPGDSVSGKAVAAAFILICELLLVVKTGAESSPVLSYPVLAGNLIEQNHLKGSLKDREVDAKRFYRPEVAGGREKPEAFREDPNLIIIFAEGLSENIVTDERDIMPNVRRYEETSLSFDNYYNHTSPTLRGLAGQLYSGYQHENHDVNGTVSVMDLLEERGYRTAFINTEPNNREFVSYVDHLGFDEIFGDKDEVHHGYKIAADDNYYSDGEAFDLLYDTVAAFAGGEDPYFVSMYTFGTHATLDSTEEMFGDGSDPELNKFFNLDCQFGLFMDRLTENGLDDNTMVVFTTDHATYGDRDFTNAFPSYKRKQYFLDEIPFFIYYKGVEAEPVDAGGRNTLCMAPTVLDLLDVSGENYFLGTSLFLEPESSLEYCYNENDVYYTSGDCDIRKLEGGELDAFKEDLLDYFAFSAAGTSYEETGLEVISSGWLHHTYTVVLKGAPEVEDLDCFALAVWKSKGQTDIIWRFFETDENGRLSVEIDEDDLPQGRGDYPAAVRVLYNEDPSEGLLNTELTFE